MLNVPSKPIPSRFAGFTLIELLVVISIIALLISILLPVLGRARDSVKQTQCLSNMRQLGIASYGYINDYKAVFPQPFHDGQIPSTADRGKAVWFNALDYYLQQGQKNYSSGSTTERNYNAFKQDPVWLELPEGPITGQGNDQSDVRTIKMNESFGEIGSGVKFVSDIEIPLATETVLFVDGRAHDTPSTTSGNIDGGGAGLFNATEVYAGLRHDEGANVTYADGHAGHHLDEIRTTGSGYQGWYSGNAATNGFAGNGPHDLVWDIP